MIVFWESEMEVKFKGNFMKMKKILQSDDLVWKFEKFLEYPGVILEVSFLILFPTFPKFLEKPFYF